MSPVIAVFSTQAPSHFRLVLPIIVGLARRGADVRVFTHARFEPEISRAGASLVDVFTPFPQEAADETSTPIGTRYVTHAGRFARAVAARSRAAQRRRRDLEAEARLAWSSAPPPDADRPATAGERVEPDDARIAQAAAVWAHVLVLTESLAAELGDAAG